MIISTQLVRLDGVSLQAPGAFRSANGETDLCSRPCARRFGRRPTDAGIGRFEAKCPKYHQETDAKFRATRVH
jgi:hypothetical protein